MISRRNLITATVALAVGATIAAPAAETGPRMVRFRTHWTWDRPDQDTFIYLPASTLPVRPWRDEARDECGRVLMVMTEEA